MATLNGTDTQDNLISCSNGVWSVGSGGPALQSLPGMPTSLIFDATRPPIPLNASNPAKNESYDAILKVSDGGPLLVIPAGAQVAQGYEDSLNLNAHASVILGGADLSVAGAVGMRVVTVKGGSTLTATGPVTVHQHGSVADVHLNAWSDQSYTPGTVDLTQWKMADGSKLKIRDRCFGKGSKLGPNGKLDLLGSLEDCGYWWAKWLVRKVIGVKVGQTGPSWLA